MKNRRLLTTTERHFPSAVREIEYFVPLKNVFWLPQGNEVPRPRHLSQRDTRETARDRHNTKEMSGVGRAQNLDGRMDGGWGKGAERAEGISAASCALVPTRLFTHPRGGEPPQKPQTKHREEKGDRIRVGGADAERYDDRRRSNKPAGRRGRKSNA